MCTRPEYDLVILAFATSFVSPRNAHAYPELDFANHCGASYDAADPYLLRCPDIEAGIGACQAAGKRVLLSLGGASGAYGFASDAQAERFADVVWDLFLGGGGPARPFGRAVLDGIDLDIEGGTPVGYAAFARRLRHDMAADPGRRYLLTAAPQCPSPDAYLGPAPGKALGDEAALFDALFVQFYNNPCAYSDPAAFGQAFSAWAALAAAGGPRVFVGLPASDQAAAPGSFVSRERLPSLLASVRGDPAFGGVMLWDASFDGSGAVPGPSYGALVADLLSTDR